MIKYMTYQKALAGHIQNNTIYWYYPEIYMSKISNENSIIPWKKQQLLPLKFKRPNNRVLCNIIDVKERCQPQSSYYIIAAVLTLRDNTKYFTLFEY